MQPEPPEQRDPVSEWVSAQRSPAARSTEPAGWMSARSPLDLVGGGEVSLKTSLDHWERERRCLPPPTHTRESLSGFAANFSASLFNGTEERFFFEPEDAPTGRSDSVCLVFLVFPRRLYQVRRRACLYYRLVSWCELFSLFCFAWTFHPQLADHTTSGIL